jgi:hypothetical protein
MSLSTYRVTLSGLLISDGSALCSAIFPDAMPTRLEYSQDYVLATFASPQTPADLGPLVKVELVTSE